MTASRRDGRKRRENDRPERPPTEERAYPHNLEAERSVLGAIILDNSSFERVFSIINASDFYRRAHDRIFVAMEDLDERDVLIDLVTLKDILGSRGELDEVGGPVYISGLIDGVPRSTNVEHYARIVREKATLRALIQGANKMLSAAYDSEESADNILGDADRLIVDLQAERGTSRMEPLRATTGALLSAVMASAENGGRLLGIDTGFASINELTLGWQRGDLTIIAARPSIGKTTFVMNSAVAGAGAAGLHVGIFSLEMRRRQLEYRLLSSLSGVPLTRVMLGNFLSEEEHQRIGTAIAKMESLHFQINDRTRLTVQDIRSECRRMKAEGGLDLVIVDYVQLIPGSLDSRNATRNDELTDISRRLKELADDCSASVILLSQLNRTSVKGDNRPKLSDLRDSGALEQDADVVGFLHRRHHQEDGYTAFIAEKQRMGACGVVALSIDRDVVTFTDGCDEQPKEKEN